LTKRKVTHIFIKYTSFSPPSCQFRLVMSTYFPQQLVFEDNIEASIYKLSITTQSIFKTFSSPRVSRTVPRPSRTYVQSSNHIIYTSGWNQCVFIAVTFWLDFSALA